MPEQYPIFHKFLRDLEEEIRKLKRESTWSLTELTFPSYISEIEESLRIMDEARKQIHF